MKVGNGKKKKKSSPLPEKVPVLSFQRTCLFFIFLVYFMLC